MGDKIDRDEAIKAIYIRVRIPHDIVSAYYADLAEKAVLSVPSEDRPQGMWIDNGDKYYRCSLCGIKDTDTWNWCHGCGARLKGANDELVQR